MILSEVRIYSHSVVAVQWEKETSLAHGMIIDKGKYNCSNHSCRIQVRNTEQLITRNSKHVEVTPITAMEYLRNKHNKNTSSGHW